MGDFKRKMKLKLTMCVISLAILSGCRPDKMEVEIYTSDIQKASSGGVVEVPLTAAFSFLGEDKNKYLPKASAVAKRYLDEKAEFKMSEGDWGDVMVVKCSVPMGTPEALKTYLATKHRPFAITITDAAVKLGATRHLKSLNQELCEIYAMLDIYLPAESTIVRFTGDMEEAPEITAIAVFVDEKPELVFQKKIERHASVDVEYNGEEASVYSEITPQFSVKF